MNKFGLNYKELPNKNTVKFGIILNVFSLLGYILIIFSFVFTIRKRLKQRVDQGFKGRVALTSLSAIGGAVGTLFSAFVNRHISDDFSSFMFVFTILLLSYLYSISINYILKYIYIKRLESSGQA